jgi:hypothetical protein
LLGTCKSFRVVLLDGARVENALGACPLDEYSNLAAKHQRIQQVFSFTGPFPSYKHGHHATVT